MTIMTTMTYDYDDYDYDDYDYADCDYDNQCCGAATF